jgi:hypothetical protein
MVGATDPHPDHLSAPRSRFVMPKLGRAEGRALALNGHVQPADDLAITRMGERVYIGIRHGGRCRLTRAEARQLAGALLEITDAEAAEGENA